MLTDAQKEAATKAIDALVEALELHEKQTKDFLALINDAMDLFGKLRDRLNDKD